MAPIHNLYAVVFALLVVGFGCCTATAQSEAGLSPVQQERYYKLLEELRCLVCQNQSLAESSADLAGDLRTQVLEMVKADKSDDEIFTFMTDRYGSFVRYQPPFNLSTLALWLAPFAVLLITLLVLVRKIRQRNQSAVS